MIAPLPSKGAPNTFRSISIAVVMALVCAEGCLPGVGDLLQDANLEVLVTGLTPGDVVVFEGDQESFQDRATTDSLSFFVDVSPGDLDGVIVVERGRSSFCLDFFVAVPTNGKALVALHVDERDICELAPVFTDGRSLLELSETAEGSCGRPSCRTTITVDGAGNVVVDGAEGAPVRGRARANDAALLTTDVLSSAADDLFGGDCEPLGGPTRDPIFLTRRFQDESGTAFVADVEVANCRSAVAARIRARLDVIRRKITESSDDGSEEGG